MNLKGLFGSDATYIHTGEIDEQSAADIATWLANKRECAKVTIVFMTFGGSVGYAFALHDTIKLMSASMEVNLVALGMCQSAGVIIMSSVEVSRRYTGPNTRFMVHALTTTRDNTKITCEPTPPDAAVLSVIEESTGIDLAEAYRLQEAVIALLSRETQLSAEKVRAMLGSDTYFSAETAVEYGLVGTILDTTSDTATAKPPYRRWYQLRARRK